MITATVVAAAIAAGVTAPATPSLTGAAGDTAREFRWSGTVAPDAWVRVRNISGSVRVETSTGNSVEITGRKIVGRHGDPDRVRIIVQRTGLSGGDVVACALWGEENSCDEHADESQHHHHWGNDDNDVSVEFTVRLPKGVNVGAMTVDGDVDINGATGQVESKTVNGSVQGESLAGPVDAETVNGDVQVKMASVVGTPRLDFHSVNGSVTVYLPAKLGADVELTTVNGDLESDFPLTTSGHLDPHRERGTIGGGGGAQVRAETVNGSIALRQAAS
jgi:hypothetical protein